MIEMRHGEIVRTPGGSIERANVLSAHPLDFPEESLEIVSIAELFEVAGHPVPKGAKIVAAFVCNQEDGRVNISSRSWLYKVVSEVEYGFFTPEGWEIVKPEGADMLDVIATVSIDLSPLPALNAWESLPMATKMVVK